MKKVILSLILVCMSTLSIAGECVVKIENKYCVELEWLEGPYTDAYSMNKVLIKDLVTKEYTELSGVTTFKVWMVMDMHAHGGAEVLTTKQGLGEYLIDEIYFFSGMNGKWQFKMVHNENEYTLFEMDI